MDKRAKLVVDRLYKGKQSMRCRNCTIRCDSGTKCTLLEAADLIESLAADNERLKGELMQMKGSRDGWKLRALNAESKIERS